MHLCSVLVFILFSVFCTSDAADTFNDVLGKRTEVQTAENEVLTCDEKIERFQEFVISVLEDRKNLMEQSFDKQNEVLEMMEEGHEAMWGEIRNAAKKLEAPITAFNAYRKADVGRVDKIRKDENIKFQVVELNEGGGYNGYNGRFTASESGVYQFSVHVCNNPHKLVGASIVHEKAFETEIIAQTMVYEDPYSSCGSVSGIAKMEQGDYVFVRSTDNSEMYLDKNYRWPSFSGFRIK